MNYSNANAVDWTPGDCATILSSMPISLRNSSTLPIFNILSLYSLNRSSHSPMTSCKLPLPMNSFINLFMYSSCFNCWLLDWMFNRLPSHLYLRESTSRMRIKSGRRRKRALLMMSFLSAVVVVLERRRRDDFDSIVEEPTRVERSGCYCCKDSDCLGSEIMSTSSCLAIVKILLPVAKSVYCPTAFGRSPLSSPSRWATVQRMILKNLCLYSFSQRGAWQNSTQLLNIKAIWSREKSFICAFSASSSCFLEADLLCSSSYSSSGDFSSSSISSALFSSSSL